LHNILQRHPSKGQERDFPLHLPAEATVGDVLDKLEIKLATEALLLVVQHRVVGRQYVLAEGDHLDVFPAISGG
jgi:molybdopterin converting factor small subunit